MQSDNLRFGKLFQCVVILGGEKHQHRIGLDSGLDELPPNNRGVLFNIPGDALQRQLLLFAHGIRLLTATP